MPTGRYDIIIIGSGAGGGTLAYALADTPADILLVERGDFVPQEPENWDPEAVWKHLRYRTRETWLDAAGEAFRPYTHYCVGGNTKFWGSVLYRLRREDFEAVEHADGVSPAWPIGYEALEPYYERAERLYQVHGASGSDPTEMPRRPFPYPAVPHADGIARYVEALRHQGLHPSPLPLGLRNPGEPDGCILCNTCNSFPCQRHAKSDTDVCCVRPISDRPNVTLWTNAHARRLLTDAAGGRVEAVEVEHDGKTQRVEAAARGGRLRRGELGGAAPAFRERPAPRRSGEFIRVRGKTLHGASGHHDAGLSPVPEEPRRVPKDGGDQ